MAALVVAYALSPIDLIPDFIPVLGLLDDLVLVPSGILLATWMIPDHVLHELRESANGLARPESRAGLVVVVLIWLAAASIMAWLLVCR